MAMGKKIQTATAKKQPKPEMSKLTAKAGAKKMAELMTRKVSHTQAMREQKQKKAKYR